MIHEKKKKSLRQSWDNIQMPDIYMCVCVCVCDRGVFYVSEGEERDHGEKNFFE